MSDPSGRKLRVGFIGAGVVVVQHLPPLEKLGRTELVGVVSRTPERAEAAVAKYGGVAYTDFTEMLDAQHPDIVFVCLPPHLAGDACALLIDRGIPFLVEKPLAADAETPVRIAAAIAARGLITAVGYQARGLDFLPQVRARFAERPPRLLVARWIGDTPPPTWWHRADQGGGQVVEQATHLFDMARNLLGEATVLAAASIHHPRAALPDLDVADVGSALLRFDGGTIAAFANSCISPLGHVEMEFVSDGLTTTLRLGGEWPRTKWTATFEDEHGVEVVTAERDPYEAQAEAFLDAVDAGDPTLVLSSYADALRTDRLTRAVVAATGAPG